MSNLEIDTGINPSVYLYLPVLFFILQCPYMDDRLYTSSRRGRAPPDPF